MPETSPYYSLVEILKKAEICGTAQISPLELQKIWGKEGTPPLSSESYVSVVVYIFSQHSPPPQIALTKGIGEKKRKKWEKKFPEVSKDLWEYYQYFGDVLPVHLWPQKTLLFGWESHLFRMPHLESTEKIRAFIEKEFWAADEEEFPGTPTALLGFDEESNLWFSTDNSPYIWTYDRSIQAVRSANYYDDDPEDFLLWSEYVPRVFERWSQPKKEKKSPSAVLGTP